MVAGEECNGGEDDGDLEEGFAQVIAGGLSFGVFDLLLIPAGDGLFFDEFVLPLVDVDFIFGDPGGGGGGVDGGLGGEDVDGDDVVVHADLFGLVLAPLIGCARLHEDGPGMGAVAEDRNHCNEDG